MSKSIHRKREKKVGKAELERRDEEKEEQEIIGGGG